MRGVLVLAIVEHDQLSSPEPEPLVELEVGGLPVGVVVPGARQLWLGPPRMQRHDLRELDLRHRDPEGLEVAPAGLCLLEIVVAGLPDRAAVDEGGLEAARHGLHHPPLLRQEHEVREDHRRGPPLDVPPPQRCEGRVGVRGEDVVGAPVFSIILVGSIAAKAGGLLPLLVLPGFEEEGLEGGPDEVLLLLADGHRHDLLLLLLVDADLRWQNVFQGSQQPLPKLVPILLDIVWVDLGVGFSDC